jgi:general stress protein YciG
MAKRTVVEPSRRGGLAVAKRYGTEYMREIGARGGNAVVDKYGSEYMSNLGTLGADAINNHLSKTRRMLTERTLRRIVNENS